MTEQIPRTPRPALGAAITLGFGAAIEMWVAGFVLRLPGVDAPAPLIALVLGLALLSCGFIAGRIAGVRAALGTGLVAGLVCLLILGSLLARETGENELRPGWPLVIAGWLAASTLACGVVGFIGALRRAPATGAIDWHARFAKVAAASILPLIIVGGLVTSHEAGLAVPDWPNSFGANMFLYPLARMTGGVYYEHAHRLFGSLVGLTTLVFMVFTLVSDRRAAVKAAAIALFVLVVAQGVMGGLRVTETNLALAIVHGITAQVFFGAMCALAAACSVRWKSGEPARGAAIAGSPRRLATVLVALLFVQLVFGAMLRHMGPTQGAHAMMAHVANAIFVLVALVAVGVRAPAAMPGDPLFRRLGKGLMHGGLAQFILGAVALGAVFTFKDREQAPALEVVLTTAHQAIGALLIALACLLLAWSRRLVLPRSAA